MRMRLVFSDWYGVGGWPVLAPAAAQGALLGANAGMLCARIATGQEKTCAENKGQYPHQKSPGIVWFSYAGSSMSCVR